MVTVQATLLVERSRALGADVMPMSGSVRIRVLVNPLQRRALVPSFDDVEAFKKSRNGAAISSTASPLRRHCPLQDASQDFKRILRHTERWRSTSLC